MTSAPVRDPTVMQLVQFLIVPDGAAMSCHYCHATARVNAQDVPSQILRFQDEHFPCDPSLRRLGRNADHPVQA